MDVTSYALSRKHTNEVREELSNKREQDKVKIALLEKELNDYKATISMINVNQEAKQKITGYGPISLPKNTANGQVSVSSIKGNTRTNLLGGKGNFENLADYSTVNQSTLSLSTDKVFGTSALRGKHGTDQSRRITFITVNNQKPSGYYLLFGFMKAIVGGIQFALEERDLGGNVLFATASSVVTNSNFQCVGVKRQIAVNANSLRVNLLAQNNGDEGIFDGFMLLEISQEEFNSLTVEQLMQKYPYISDTKSTFSSIRYKSISKNMFNKNKIISTQQVGANGTTSQHSTRFTTEFIKVRAGDIIAGFGAYYPMAWYDINKTLISFDNGATTVKTAPANAMFFRATSEIANIDTYQLERGVTTPYTPYSENNQYVIVKDEQGKIVELRLVGNAKDEIRPTGNGYEHVKRTEKTNLPTTGWIFDSMTDNIVRAFLTLSLQLPYLQSPNTINHSLELGNVKWDSIGQVNGITSGTYTAIDKETSALRGQSTPQIYVNISKTKLSTLDSTGINAFMLANQPTITYQLAVPVITPAEVSGTLIGYPSGTIFAEKIVPDAGIYSNKMTILKADMPIKRIDALSKIDFTTGLETALNANLATIAGDKQSFTHPNLLAGDLVFFEYEYDLESTEGELTIEYYDSRYTIKDSATEKFYKWNVTVTNGVPSLSVVEV